ncbi:SH2 domain-containing protein 1B-like isoform X5 [Neoarius graeffei]|uniref:SH2 domain-containing protein 1B-like isoform X5 n=1 Tax=Neoarius graeffei TaxID=443677 RepID=UPI00298BEB88|nr:SH2 domain-containing protein 1B-like isoform X5 [Neoarius graeffei]
MLQNMYYGQIGQRDVEWLLGKYGKDGSFLLRDSQSERGALCLCVRKTPFVHTYRIVHSPQGWALENQPTWKCDPLRWSVSVISQVTLLAFCYLRKLSHKMAMEQ